MEVEEARDLSLGRRRQLARNVLCSLAAKRNGGDGGERELYIFVE
jgi:hypothetical protein